MFTTLRNAWKIEDLRKKLLFTLFILIIFRLGSAITVPFLDPSAIKSMIGDGSLLGYIDMLTGGGFSRSTIFALSVTPYINASIIIQLLTIAIPALERLSKEGEEGRRKISRITRYVGCGIAGVLSIAYFMLLKGQGALTYADTKTFSFWFAAAVIVFAFTAGSMLIMWLGEQIDSKGIGNGISLLIFAGIVSRSNTVIKSTIDYFNAAMKGETQYFFILPAILILAIVTIAFIVVLNSAERRIPVQYAKRVVGRKQYGGQSTHIPIKVNMSGVMPIIFASALISIPGTIRAFFFPNVTGFWASFFNFFNYNNWGYAAFYLLLIIAFNYFYVAVQYNPIEIANNLRKNNGAVPGIRPGKPTSDFITKILSKITFIGAIFLGVVAILPIALGNVANVNIQLGGTSLLIVVGVALDTSRQLESYMLMRHHKGFLE